MMVNAAALTETPQPEPTTQVTISSVFRTVSNKYVDIVFSDGVYRDMGRVNPVNSANFSIVEFVGGGVSNVAIAAVKRNTHYTFASALDLIGGENVVRVFLTLTGTPDSTESFRIQCSNIYSPDGGVTTVTTETVKINITPLMLWDYLETASVSTLSLGINQFSDVMGAANFTQNTTDANRPIDGGDFIGFNSSGPKWMSAGDVAALEFQKGDSFTIVVKRFKPTNSGSGGYLISKRGRNTAPSGWAITVGSDGSLFFIMNDGTLQGACDYDAFSPAAAEHTLFFINNNGTMNIIEDENTTRGTTGNATGIGTITYGTIPVLLGRRDVDTNQYLSGSFEKIAIVNKAMSLDERTDFLENMN